MTEIARDILAAATTLAGLLIVFLGGLVVRYEGMDAERRKTLGKVYRRRGTLAFIGFLSASGSAGLCIFSHATGSELAARIGAVLMVIAFAAVIAAAILIYRQLFE